MTPPKRGVKIRMYRQGLGDCFLLAFPGKNGKTFYMLIDCGVILGTPAPEPLMQRVVDNIAAATGRRLDLVVATHEHWDHVSGFLQADKSFEKIRIENLWLAWTENTRDPLAKKLRADRKRKEQALRVALQRTAGTPAANSPWAAEASELLGFFGLGAKGRKSTDDAMRAVQQLSQREPRYCLPGEDPIALPELPGIRFYVLGPPKDERAIKRSDPSRAHPEVYEKEGFGLEAAFFAAALGDGLAAAELFDDPELVHRLSFPFDEAHQVKPSKARKDKVLKAYFDRAESWRAIDDDWMEMAGQLALQLDSDTNNTSLALAIELTDSGKVLLFPGDAQVGNWLSWDQYEWTVDGKKVNAEDLLRRTVFYKVGHHGSHNATLREKGLERMTHPELVAMIPVSQDMAKKRRWKMPFEPLYRRLEEKTSGRIMQVQIHGDDRPLGAHPVPQGLSKTAWQGFRKRVNETKLSFDYTVE